MKGTPCTESPRLVNDERYGCKCSQRANRRPEVSRRRVVYGAFVDINGVPKAKGVPIAHLSDALNGSELYTRWRA